MYDALCIILLKSSFSILRARTRVDTVLHLRTATILGLDPLTEVLGRPLPVVPQRRSHVVSVAPRIQMHDCRLNRLSELAQEGRSTAC